MNKWDQLFSDGTGRCHTTLHNLVIGVIDEELLCTNILSTYIILEGEASEQQVDDVLSTISGFGKRLQWWEDGLDNSHPSYYQDIPETRSMNIGKFGSSGDLALDTCNGEKKMCRLIVEKVHEAVEDFCKYDSDCICVL